VIWRGSPCVFSGIGIKTIVELYTTLTWIETFPADLMKSAERAWNVHRLLNANIGFGRKDDRPPQIWFTPLEGTDVQEYPLYDYYRKNRLTNEDLEGSMDDYYDERGWDKEMGLPMPEKL
jgi:aldehyde:ferredoxin oxidoreductase